ncbi:MAG: MFS transporter, partial [Elusimicrobiota bacterium]
ESGPGGKRLGLFDWGAYAQYFRRPALAAVLVQFFLFCVMCSLFMAGFALFAKDRFSYTAKEVGYLYAYSGLIGVIIQGGLLGRLVKRFGESALARAGFLAAAAGLTALAFTGPLAMLLAAFTAIAFGTGVLRPALTSLVTRHVGRGEQGVVLGLTQSLNSTSSILSPLAAGFLIGHERLHAWALLAASVSAVGLVLGLLTRKQFTTKIVRYRGEQQ